MHSSSRDEFFLLVNEVLSLNLALSKPGNPRDGCAVMSRKQKILVCGDVEGNFKTLFSRVNAINKKNGPFDFLFCVGDFFSESSNELEPYKKGSLTVSVPTYILGPNSVTTNQNVFYDSFELSGTEICPNVNYLGKYGIFSSSGLRIAYMSGIEHCDQHNKFTFTESDAKALRESALRNKAGLEFSGVDILLTSEWPKDVEKLDKNFKYEDQSEIKGSAILSELAYHLKPRYHFCGLKNIYYERPPYRNDSDNLELNSHSTRFIALAKVGNSDKKKWLYAANVSPLVDLKKSDLWQSTTDETPCPYTDIVKKKNKNKTTQYFYDMDSGGYDDGPRKRRKNNGHSNADKRKTFDDPETCWFCLASNSVEKHLVISIADEVYLALAKGGLTPLHCLIVPVKHQRSLAELSKSAMMELKKYKTAVRKFFETKNQVPVIFERNYKTSHLQLQIVPVPNSLTRDLKEIFLNFSQDSGIKLSELPRKAKLKDFTQPGAPYFYVELPTKEKLICTCEKNFPIQFGREVLASRAVLNLSDKINWRDCIKSKEEENEMATNFRKQFESFDEFA
ncbi:conserved hypothetical protein [Pediculus humanus corporis]|uniref:CWF19-like protein 1 n=1 Tax=Pediculus humanus subsp. corporis TaxID=121224 RepID=E0VZR3_PEDHC|nr:uncharacterized protein Phum_PHUM537410 [Pediculus humanus corporis]EEB18869.1 conserved hypothetical protein [Pediculus humanus corporis]